MLSSAPLPAFAIFTPQAGRGMNVQTDDDVTGVICAAGVAVTDQGVPARAVWGKVFNTAAVNPTPTPPNDAVGALVQPKGPNLGAWSMDQTNGRELPGASCSLTAPFPDNTLVLWFDWPDIGYQAYPIYFLGMASDHTECD